MRVDTEHTTLDLSVGTRLTLWSDGTFVQGEIIAHTVTTVTLRTPKKDLTYDLWHVVDDLSMYGYVIRVNPPYCASDETLVY